jgi:hypothetical protein
MGAVDVAAIADSMLGDVVEATAFSLCAYNELRLVPRLGIGFARWTGEAIEYDPTEPVRHQCVDIVLAASRAKLPDATECEVLHLADLLNERLCPAP